MTRRRTTRLLAAAALGLLALPTTAQAGKVGWLDNVVREVVREAEAGGRAAARGGDGAATVLRGSGRLFGREADEGLEVLVKRSDDLARASRPAEAAGDALLQRRFARLLPHDPDAVRTFSALAPAEKRLVVEMSETAQRLARTYPGRAEGMIRSLGTDGLSAVRVYGDDVAEVLVKEGPEGLGVLRKTGRGGWAFFTRDVLPHKKKLAAAGVLALFLADPDKFVDYTGRATEYAVREFSKAGVALAGAVGQGAGRGFEAAVAGALAPYGLSPATTHAVALGAAGLTVVLAAMVLVGVPLRSLARPFGWAVRSVRARPTPVKSA